MRLVFFDPSTWDYDVSTPLEVGLGGSQSAACYLAAELARRGHAVAFVNGVKRDYLSTDVRFLNQNNPETNHLIRECDALIVLNASMGRSLRHSGVRCPMVLWTQHDADQPAIKDLTVQGEVMAWTRIVCVSKYQQQRYKEILGVNRTEVIGNAISPAFLEEPIRAPWYMTGEAPVLTYTSTPFRGLDKLLDAFPVIREAIPEVRLRLFSDMRLYHASDEPYEHLYARAARMEGVDCLGSIGQRQLARELSRCALLAYPCTFPETFCIAALESASVGCTPVVPPLAALPEVLGFAGIYVLNDYAKVVIQILRGLKAERPETASVTRAGLIEMIRTECTWARRAADWEAMLTTATFGEAV